MRKKEIGTNFVGLLFIRTESYSLLDKLADLVATLGVQSQPYLPYYQFELLELLWCRPAPLSVRPAYWLMEVTPQNLYVLM